MTIVKCDLCKKEVKTPIKRGVIDRELDFCEDCYNRYDECETKIVEKRKEIRKKYEEEIKIETEKILKEYQINFEEEEDEEEGI